MGNYYVYITKNPGKTVLYTGVTDDVNHRLQEHFENRGKITTFAGKYYCYKLIYYEYFTDIKQVITREKEIKNMKSWSKRTVRKVLSSTIISNA